MDLSDANAALKRRSSTVLDAFISWAVRSWLPALADKACPEPAAGSVRPTQNLAHHRGVFGVDLVEHADFAGLAVRIFIDA